MASIFSSLSPSHSPPPPPPPSPLLFRSKAIHQYGNRWTQIGDKSQIDTGSRVCVDEGFGSKRRRDVLLQILLSASSLPLLASEAFAENVQENFKMYEDQTNKFRILVPKGWFVGAGDAGSIKSITVFYPDEASDSNVSIAITGVGPDFTSLKSYGSVDVFAETLVNGLDRSWKSPPGLAAKLIDCKSANGLYYVEYTLQNPGESCRHLFTATGMASNGWYNRLFTITGQFVEDGSEKYRSEIEKSVSSFSFT